MREREIWLKTFDSLNASANKNSVLALNDEHTFSLSGTETSNGEAAPTQDPSAAKNPSMDSAEWVELFVREMMSASNIDDAKARASRALEVLEKSIRVSVSAEAAQSFQQVISLLLFTFLLYI